MSRCLLRHGCSPDCGPRVRVEDRSSRVKCVSCMESISPARASLHGHTLSASNVAGNSGCHRLADVDSPGLRHQMRLNDRRPLRWRFHTTVEASRSGIAAAKFHPAGNSDGWQSWLSRLPRYRLPRPRTFRQARCLDDSCRTHAWFEECDYRE